MPGRVQMTRYRITKKVFISLLLARLLLIPNHHPKIYRSRNDYRKEKEEIGFHKSAVSPSHEIRQHQISRWQSARVYLHGQ